MSLATRLVKLLNRKRGHAHVRLPSKKEVRTFRCRHCGYLLKILKVDLAAHYIHPEIRGMNIPEKLGCPRCDAGKVAVAIPSCKGWWARMDELKERTGLPMSRIYGALKWREEQRR